MKECTYWDIVPRVIILRTPGQSSFLSPSTNINIENILSWKNSFKKRNSLLVYFTCSETNQPKFSLRSNIIKVFIIEAFSTFIRRVAQLLCYSVFAFISSWSLLRLLIIQMKINFAWYNYTNKNQNTQQIEQIKTTTCTLQLCVN